MRETVDRDRIGDDGQCRRVESLRTAAGNVEVDVVGSSAGVGFFDSGAQGTHNNRRAEAVARGAVGSVTGRVHDEWTGRRHGQNGGRRERRRVSKRVCRCQHDTVARGDTDGARNVQARRSRPCDGAKVKELFSLAAQRRVNFVNLDLHRIRAVPDGRVQRIVNRDVRSGNRCQRDDGVVLQVVRPDIGIACIVRRAHSTGPEGDAA